MPYIFITNSPNYNFIYYRTAKILNFEISEKDFYLTQIKKDAENYKTELDSLKTLTGKNSKPI